jgi:hypothetical protein
MIRIEQSSIPDDLQLVSIPVFAKRAGDLNYFTISKWISKGRLRSVKVGGRRMIPVSELRRVCSEGLEAEVV